MRHFALSRHASPYSRLERGRLNLLVAGYDDQYYRLWAFIVHCTVPAAADDIQQVQTDAIFVICLAYRDFMHYQTCFAASNLCKYQCDRQYFVVPCFYLLLITVANSLDADQDRQNVGPDLHLNRLTLSWKKLILKNISRPQRKCMEKLPLMQRVNTFSAISDLKLSAL